MRSTPTSFISSRARMSAPRRLSLDSTSAARSIRRDSLILKVTIRTGAGTVSVPRLAYAPRNRGAVGLGRLMTGVHPPARSTPMATPRLRSEGIKTAGRLGTTFHAMTRTRRILAGVGGLVILLLDVLLSVLFLVR